MRNLKATALFAAGLIMLTSFGACNKKKETESKVEHSRTAVENINDVNVVTPEEEVGSIKHEAKLAEAVTVGDTVFTVNNIIDIDHITGDGRYIYIDYTIENKSDKDYPTDAINNFYINVDGVEDIFDIRSDVFAKRYINGYSSEFTIAANTQISNYVGFVIPKDAKEITVGYYVTGSDRDKKNIVLCKAKPDDFVSPPAGMIKSEE
ncbi:MAG: DUF4352 domain-containing protein [Ruminococcus sp.]|nr:DUF4352 domain-containing protein [Ruminococcus sp.]MBR6671229.1 DUF4352 domain-containing protein [Ruminococcus sp.]